MEARPISSEAGLITGEQLLAMGDLGPCELIDGRIVSMAPTGIAHGIIESNLALELGLFARERDLGWVMSGEVGVYTRRNPDRVRGADVVLLSRARCPQDPFGGFLEVAPEMVAEVLSPNDPWQDVRQKMEEYFDLGVLQVWIIEPRNRAVLVYRSTTEARKYGESDTIVGEGILEGFSLPVARLFPE